MCQKVIGAHNMSSANDYDSDRFANLLVQFLVRLFRRYDADGTEEVDKDKLIKAGWVFLQDLAGSIPG